MRQFLPLAAIAAASALSTPAQAQRINERITDGVIRTFADQNAKNNAEPSVALDGAFPALATVTDGAFSPNPVFSFQNNLQTVTIAIEPGTNLYATGSQSGPLERAGRRVEYYNLDNFAWNDSSNRNYQTHPWILAVRADGTAFGVLFDTTWPSSLNAESPYTNGVIFQSEGPTPAVITMEGNSPQEVVQKLAEVTGYPFMPPMWSVGYHQSKYSYIPQSYALFVAQEFRNRNIPAEVIWMDIDYMDGFRNFTTNGSLFPNPAQLNQDLDNIGFQGVWMANCGIKVDGFYDAYNEMNAGGFWVRDPGRFNQFQGEVWPGLSVWPDYTMQSTRTWWAGRIQNFAQSLGIDGIWNDMNEPAVFNVASKTMPDNNWHLADADLGGPNIHRKYHNIYGMQMSRATREGMLQAFPDKRPFVLTRAGYIGGQRYAAMWTGDNVANWYHVDVSIQNILNIGLSGQPNNGPDIGGFNGDSGAEMYARWMGMGALMPFSRGHYGFANRDREPWSYGSGTEDTSRRALNRRYRLINFMYSLFHEAHTTGLPVTRPLFFAEPSNPDLRFFDDGFLIGDGLLVVGATKPGAVPQLPPMQTPVYEFSFPDLNGPTMGRDSDDTDLPNLYALGGHIIPANDLVQHSRLLSNTFSEPLELIVALDENGQASGTLYEDEGDGWGYQNGGFVEYGFTATRDPNSGQVIVNVSQISGALTPQSRDWTVRVLTGNEQEVTSFTPGFTVGNLVVNTTPTPTPEAQPYAAAIDGRMIRDFFQTGPLAENTRDRFSEISQLRALYGEITDDGLRIGIEGELDIEGTAIAVFVDSAPGGQSFINTSPFNPPPSGLQALTGTVMDSGFQPDHLLFANGFNGSIFADWVSLPEFSAGSKDYLGQGFMGNNSGDLNGGNNPHNIKMALGTNTHAARAGFEILIPFSAMNNDGSLKEARVLAAIVKPNGQITNQTLPQPSNDWPSFAPDFSNIPGDQFALVTRVPEQCSIADLDGNGFIDVFDLIAFLQNFNPNASCPADAACATADLDGNDAIDVFDLITFLQNFDPSDPNCQG